MRKLIAAMKISLDGRIEPTEGGDHWVSAWSEDYGLTPQIDACVLGAGMYSGYERYWTTIQNAPDRPVWEGGNAPTPGEVQWAELIKRTPHYVLSSTAASAAWPSTRFLRSTVDVAALKGEKGKDIYLVGGARTTSGLIDAGLVDELRLIIYPLIAGPGKALFATAERRRGLELKQVEQMEGGLVRMVYGIA
jgi:dihydrofolate reductase